MMKKSLLFAVAGCLLACSAASRAKAELIYAIAPVANATNLLSFDSATPGTVISANFVSGLQPNETILGIDVRPATGELFALGSTSRLYTLNPTNGAATQVGSGQFTPTLNGFSFGFDFNPTIDRIRVVSETNKNYVLNPNTGTVQLAATDLNFAAADPNFGVDPNVVHSAYSNNFVGAQASQLYGIDTALNVLVTQANNTGVLGTVGGLGVDPAAAGGFDISGVTGIAYAVMLPSNASQSSLYTINLATGAATSLGVVNGGLAITAMTVANVIPEPSTIALAACGLVGCVYLRRRSR